MRGHKIQHTHAHIEEHMLLRYGECPLGLKGAAKQHKHDKRHHLYRQHCRTHGVHFEITQKNQTHLKENLRKAFANQRIH